MKKTTLLVMFGAALVFLMGCPPKPVEEPAADVAPAEEPQAEPKSDLGTEEEKAPGKPEEPGKPDEKPEKEKGEKTE